MTIYDFLNKTNKADPKEQSLLWKIAVGVVAGGLGNFVATPTDLVKIRMVNDHQGLRYSGLIDAFKKIYAEEGGFIALYKGCGPNTTRAAVGGFVVLFRLRLGIGALFRDQGFAIRNRDLVVIGMDLGKREEPMAIAAIVNERSLKRWFDPCYFCEIYISGELPFVFGFKVKFLNLVSVNHHDAGLFRVGGIDKHFLGHLVFLHPRKRLSPGGANVCGK